MMGISREERHELIGFNDVKLRLVLVPVLSYFFPIVVMGLNPSDDLYFESLIISLIHIVGYWEFDRYIVIRLRKKYHTIEHYKERLMLQTVIIGGITVAFCLFSKWVQLCFSSAKILLNISLFNYLTASLIITILILTIYEARFAFTQWKNHLIKNEILEKENSLAQLEVLKNQVNPHFFFNAINTLISVIPDNPKTAIKFAENLSSVYRCILEMKDKEIVSLEEEFECIDAYKYLLGIRFDKNVTFVGDENCRISDKYIVPLSVQMLVENTIKHNVVSTSRPLEINFKVTNEYLEVSNNFQAKISEEPSTKIGHKNINKRYQILINKNIEVIQKDNRYIVRLPLINISEVK